MTTQPAETASRIELANRVAKRIRIENVRLVGSRFDRKVLSDSSLPDRLQMAYGFKVQDDFDAEAKRISAGVIFLLSGKADQEDAAEIFKIEAKFVLDYILTGEASPRGEEITAFAKLNGIYHAWPYWREYVQSVASRMGLPRVVLPALTPGSIEKMVEEEERRASDKERKEDSAEVGSDSRSEKGN